MIKLLVNDKETKFETTIFPDGTSQVWKIDEKVKFIPGELPVILWHFENEGELMHVLQLGHLVQKHFKIDFLTLRAPYLPYGRQDKKIDNSLSFALTVFKETLNSAGIIHIETFDAHSGSESVYNDTDAFNSLAKFHKSILNHDVVCFPDAGACDRYYDNFKNSPKIYCEKVRNQLTGEITGLTVTNPSEIDLSNKKIIIIDDICDGGMTFIKVTEALKAYNPNQIDLAVSHGLFSKGKQCLHDAGITNIYTTDSLLRNAGSFKVLV